MTAQPSPRGHPKPLSPREQMVLALIAEGLTNSEIAESLHLARSTVKRYVSSMMWKLEVHTREGAVREASKQTGSSFRIEELTSA
jgi:LuxR family transcriptional regulator, regulator of acetate metabolism